MGRRPLGCHRPRQPAGDWPVWFVPEGLVSGGDMRLDLWNGEARGKLQTTAGAVEWRSMGGEPKVAVANRRRETGGVPRPSGPDIRGQGRSLRLPISVLYRGSCRREPGEPSRPDLARNGERHAGSRLRKLAEPPDTDLHGAV